VFFSLKEVGSGTLAVVKVMNKTTKIRLDLVGRRSYRGGVLMFGSFGPRMSDRAGGRQSQIRGVAERRAS